MSLSIYNFKKFLIWLQITHCHFKKLWKIYFLKYFLFYSRPTLFPFFFFILIPLLPFHLSWKLLPLKGNYLAFIATTAMASIFKFLMWKKKKVSRSLEVDFSVIQVIYNLYDPVKKQKTNITNISILIDFYSLTLICHIQR